MQTLAYIDNDGTPIYSGDAQPDSAGLGKYAPYLNYAALQRQLPVEEAGQGWQFFQDPGTLEGLFGAGYTGRGANVNPYGSATSRDALRSVAQKLGLTGQDADKAALDFALHHYNTFGQGYSDATHPAIVADEIAQRLFKQAGKPYQPLSAEQYSKFKSDAEGWQQHLKERDKSDWERDDIGGAISFIGQVMQDRWEALLNDPERSATPGPISTWIQNKVLNKDNDPITDIWGGATQHDYQQAQKAGMETGGAEVIQWMIEQVAAMEAGQALGAGFEAAGLTSAEAAAASSAIRGGAGAMAGNGGLGDVLKGALGGAVKSGVSNSLGGDLYASNDTGTLTDAAPDAGTSAGSTGGSMWDEEGNWIGDQNDPNQTANTGLTNPDGTSSDTYTQGANTGLTGGSDPNWWQQVAGALGSAGSGLGGLLKGILGGGGSSGTGTTSTGTADTGGLNLARLLGTLGSAGLGAAGSKNLANKYDSMGQRYEGFGQDYRDRLAQTYRDPNSFLNSPEVQAPVQQGTDALARSLSMKGNPAGSPAALQQMQDYSANQLFGRLGEERSRLAGFGGLNTFAAAAPGALSKAADAGAGVYNAAGSGLADITNPQPTLMDFLKQLKTAGFA